jgi:DNA (cytosine-5)-methyltransferase 1
MVIPSGTAIRALAGDAPRRSKDALCDLPPITLHLEGKLKRGARRFTQRVDYQPINADELSPYAQQMRSWPGFESRDGLYDHVLRYLPRDSPIFKAMKPGMEYPAAHTIALRLFETKARRLKLEARSAQWKRLRAAMVPPYDPTKFPNRWWKLSEDKPVRTLTAHIGKDTYSHIHFDSNQARVISVREAARLQSFPDGFIFSGTMNPAFRQIGNAVPPVLARQLASSILGSLAAVVRPALAAE